MALISVALYSSLIVAPMEVAELMLLTANRSRDVTSQDIASSAQVAHVLLLAMTVSSNLLSSNPTPSVLRVHNVVTTVSVDKPAHSITAAQ